MSGFALGSLVDRQTGSPFLTAVSMDGATFATVLGALTLMSVADGRRPRRFGRFQLCHDDQGTPLGLHQSPAGG